MIHGVHIEVLLAAAYALLLVGIAVILEFVARHSHRRSEQLRNSGFTYKREMDVWECPAGHHLAREETDFERKIARYRAAAHKCNACHLKEHCTDSDDGRRLESRLDAWLQSELSRFHRGISLTLLLLAALFLTVEMFKHRGTFDWLVLAGLLIPLSFGGSKYLVFFIESKGKSSVSPNNHQR